MNTAEVDTKGMEVVASSDIQHRIAVDVGPYTLRGRILDENGSPVADAGLGMEPVLDNNDVLAITTRTVHSGTDGSFIFTGLGTGERTITVASQSHAEQSFSMDPAVETNGQPLVLR